MGQRQPMRLLAGGDAAGGKVQVATQVRDPRSIAVVAAADQCAIGGVERAHRPVDI
jgi:hypothetical protein